MHAGQDRVFFRGLNGIRALAAVGVVISHALSSTNRVGLPPRVPLQFAGIGVTIFFTLSGFLITYLLLREKRIYASIDLRQFYLRRILRIWPLYFFYIIAALSVTWLLGDEAVANTRYLILFLLFLPNIAFNLNRYPSDVGHLWSIGIEEQFYAFWPVILNRITRVARFLIVLVVVLVVARTCLKIYSLHIGKKLPFSLSISMRFDCMAIGALFAIGYERKIPRVLAISRSLGVAVAFWGMVLLSCLNRFSMFSFYRRGRRRSHHRVLILREIESSKQVTLLENPIASFIGMISFGIYVYHPIVVSIIVHCVKLSDLTFIHASVFIVVVITLTVAVAWVSYRIVEAPFLRIKERFARIRSGQIKA